MEYYHCSEKFFNISSTPPPPNSKVKNNSFSFLFFMGGRACWSPALYSTLAIQNVLENSKTF